MTLLGQIMDRLQSEFEQSGKSRQFFELKGFLIGEHGDTTYAQFAARLNMTEAAVRKTASRMRMRYRELLRDEIAQTVEGPDEVDDEVRNLMAALQM